MPQQRKPQFPALGLVVMAAVFAAAAFVYRSESRRALWRLWRAHPTPMAVIGCVVFCGLALQLVCWPTPRQMESSSRGWSVVLLLLCAAYSFYRLLAGL
jgi:hypothetical protein